MNLKMRRYCNRIAAQMMTYEGHELMREKLKKRGFYDKNERIFMKYSSNDHDIEIFHDQYAEILQLFCVKNRHVGHFICFFAVKISTKGAYK
ncbi:hypothetical protein IC766_13570 [Acinetobacter seifertii]|nr:MULTISPECIES: hypothetical protein [Acinetobacter]QNX58650.1 hypothetical protein IC782_04795 [Acinetobacter seifertii]QNX66337.1 hypothetical protein IC780_04800 [Acinetobacter seifertii]QNX97192.1 hypothetical protein IC771_04795 [Acinetobacter seifertii]QNY15961.1 hypothetical protein IC766_13570 [Acinetobacter seifertii]